MGCLFSCCKCAHSDCVECGDRVNSDDRSPPGRIDPDLKLGKQIFPHGMHAYMGTSGLESFPCSQRPDFINGCLFGARYPLSIFGLNFKPQIAAIINRVLLEHMHHSVHCEFSPTHLQAWLSELPCGPRGVGRQPLKVDAGLLPLLPPDEADELRGEVVYSDPKYDTGDRDQRAIKAAAFKCREWHLLQMAIWRLLKAENLPQLLSRPQLERVLKQESDLTPLLAVTEGKDAPSKTGRVRFQYGAQGEAVSFDDLEPTIPKMFGQLLDWRFVDVGLLLGALLKGDVVTIDAGPVDPNSRHRRAEVRVLNRFVSQKSEAVTISRWELVHRTGVMETV